MRELLHGSVSVEVFLAFGASSDEVRVEWSSQFLHLCKVVLVLGPGLALPGVEEEVAREHFVHHAPEGPHVCSLIIALPKDYLW